MHNQKEDNNQSKINKQPEVPENQTSWNSNNQRIKEKNQLEQPEWQCHNAAKRVALPGSIPKAPPPYNLSGALRQRNMAQMKEQRKTSERQLSNEEIVNLSDGEFKSLLIKMLTDLTELG